MILIAESVDTHSNNPPGFELVGSRGQDLQVYRQRLIAGALGALAHNTITDDVFDDVLSSTYLYPNSVTRAVSIILGEEAAESRRALVTAQAKLGYHTTSALMAETSLLDISEGEFEPVTLDGFEAEIDDGRFVPVYRSVDDPMLSARGAQKVSSLTGATHFRLRYYLGIEDNRRILGSTTPNEQFGTVGQQQFIPFADQ